MPRFLWASLLAVSAWLSAGGGVAHRHASRSELAAAALDAPARPAAPPARDALALLRQLALRGDDRRHSRQLGAAPLADAHRGLAPAALRRTYSAAIAPREPRRLVAALAFPYDATAPPPAGRRA